VAAPGTHPRFTWYPGCTGGRSRGGAATEARRNPRRSPGDMVRPGRPKYVPVPSSAKGLGFPTHSSTPDMRSGNLRVDGWVLGEEAPRRPPSLFHFPAHARRMRGSATGFRIRLSSPRVCTGPQHSDDWQLPSRRKDTLRIDVDPRDRRGSSLWAGEPKVGWDSRGCAGKGARHLNPVGPEAAESN
jgi:hypothetical protein